MFRWTIRGSPVRVLIAPHLTGAEHIALIRQHLGGTMPQHVEITPAQARAIDAANTVRSDDEASVNEFWRNLDARLRDAEREYP
jgi:hypothetical protein